MTCNELITLLSIYRQGGVESIRCGTTSFDLVGLCSRKLICNGGNDLAWTTTEKGTRRVEALLELMS